VDGLPADLFRNWAAAGNSGQLHLPLRTALGPKKRRKKVKKDIVAVTVLVWLPYSAGEKGRLRPAW
jgi:hypothetical protein